MADDDVFLQALQVVDLRRGRGLGEDAGRFLEARRRDERARRERGLRDAEQDGLGLRLLAPLFLRLAVLGGEDEAVDDLALQERRVAGS